MPHDLPLKLDHVGIAVHDLDAGQRAFERLGFTLTPRSLHGGAVTPGGPVEPWGSGNHCAMFREGYLEVLGVWNPELYSSARKMLAKYEGAHIIALGVEDAAAAHAALAPSVPGLMPPRTLERDAAFGPGGRETRRARFSNTYTDEAAVPEARFILIQHHTRDVLWQPHPLEHENGAVGIAEVAICADDPAAAGRLEALFGAPLADKGHGIRAADLAHGRVYLLPSALVPKWAKGVAPPAVPSVVGVGITVADLDRTKALLEARGVPFTPFPYPAIWVAPEYAGGAVLSFIQA